MALRVRFRTGEQLVQEGSTVDVGMGGAFIDARSLPLMGQSITLLFASPTAWDDLEIACKVRWVSDGTAGRARGFGVRFEGLSAGQSSALYELLQAADFLDPEAT